MKTEYIHPNLDTTESEEYAFRGIFNIQEQKFVERHPLLRPHHVIQNPNEFFSSLRKMEELRISLGIPVMSYCAHSFWSRGYDTLGVGRLIAWSRKNYETRWWVNEETGLLLICIADPDTTEDAGLEFYEKGKSVTGRNSYHMPAWWEFCIYGIAIPPNWLLSGGPARRQILARSPDGIYIMAIG
jgi:hypothetical protein